MGEERGSVGYGEGKVMRQQKTFCDQCKAECDYRRLTVNYGWDSRDDAKDFCDRLCLTKFLESAPDYLKWTR